METVAPERNPDRKGDPLYTHGKVKPNKKKPKVNRKAYAIRLSEEEHMRLKGRAKVFGYSNISEFIRHHVGDVPVKEYKPYSHEIADLVRELRNVGNNINQIARHLNEHIKLGLLTSEQVDRAINAKEWLGAMMFKIHEKLP